MPRLKVNPYCDELIQGIRRLQAKWEHRIPDLTRRGRRAWGCGVCFGIEIALHRIAEDCLDSISGLNSLLNQWERVLAEEELANSTESIKGVDHGIRLVISRGRLFLGQPARRKPASADTGGNPPCAKRKRARS